MKCYWTVFSKVKASLFFDVLSILCIAFQWLTPSASCGRSLTSPPAASHSVAHQSLMWKSSCEILPLRRSNGDQMNATVRTPPSSSEPLPARNGQLHMWKTDPRPLFAASGSASGTGPPLSDRNTTMALSAMPLLTNASVTRLKLSSRAWIGN